MSGRYNPEWEPVDNAEGYFVQLSLLVQPGIEIVYRTFNTTDNQVEVTNLILTGTGSGVRIINRYDGCADTPMPSLLRPAILSTPPGRSLPTDFHIRPNPQDAGRP